VLTISNQLQRLTDRHIIFLSTISFVNSLIFYYFPLNLLDRNDDWLNGVGFVMVWSVVYYLKLKMDGYEITSNDSFYLVKNWKFCIIMILGMTIFIYLLEGLKSIWKGPIFSILIIIGMTIQFWIEYKFINKKYRWH
jgi:hypothetical protein